MINVAIACEQQDLQLVQKLVRENGAPVNEEGGSKSLPGIIYAASHGNADLVAFLISSGCACSCSDAFKTTPLHYVARLGFTDLCRRMITESDGNVNASDKNQLTPLHLAAHYGHKETVSYLLRQGADPFQKNIFGEKAIDLVVAGLRRRSSGIFDGSENIEDLINFSFTQKNINRLCQENMVEPKNVMHLIGDIYMLNLQLILEDIDRTMKRLSSRKRFGKQGAKRSEL